LAYIQFLGAAGTVTGSKHLINTGDPSGKNGFQVLIDCGLFQVPKNGASETGVIPRFPPSRSMRSFSPTHTSIIVGGFRVW
jgi:Cft2 family RNA processing exonuclease